MDACSLEDFLDRRVVLDTQESLIFIGRLLSFDERGYWLADADVHDCPRRPRVERGVRQHSAQTRQDGGRGTSTGGAYSSSDVRS